MRALRAKRFLLSRCKPIAPPPSTPRSPSARWARWLKSDATPLMNAVDTTNGYVLEKDQIDAVPLPTGSFTGLAILSPGVNAELPGGTGANSGLGNQPIWANGQRDTSNSFLLNGVDASNLFNGKSTSQVASARIVNNTGVANAASTSAAPIQSTASVYLAIGQALPTPAPETITEVRVNTSMYDAQQGSTSGAHIDMSTASGTNTIHGTAYIHRGTDWLNAAPVLRQAGCQHSRQRQSSAVASLHVGWNAGRRSHQRQTVRLCQLSAPARFRPGDRPLADAGSGRASAMIVRQRPWRHISNTILGHQPHRERRPESRCSCTLSVQVTQRPVLDPVVGWPNRHAHLSGKRDQPGHGLLHRRSGSHRSRLEQKHQRYRLGEILLSARSQRCSLRLLQRCGIRSASRCRQPGCIASPTRRRSGPT